MKKQLKKGIALLAAGVLLTTSAAAYAAQLPDRNEAPVPAYSSSQQELSVSIGLSSYTLTADRIYAQFEVTPTGMRDLQFRAASYDVLVEVEDGADTSNFVPVLSGPQQGSPRYYTLDQPISINKGERVHVRLTASGLAFLGYTPIGDATGTEDFYFTL